eukprot:m.78950 g.78950  ORF g.78950 m.78950 type:complete len:378 (+) comp36120_c1_seq2:244-1377(+)
MSSPRPKLKTTPPEETETHATSQQATPSVSMSSSSLQPVLSQATSSPAPQPEPFRRRLRGEWRAKVLEIGLPDVLRVTCGDIAGDLHLSRLGSGSRGPSVCVERGQSGEFVWYTPNQFESQSDRAKVRNWKRSIKYQGRPLQTYSRLGLLKWHNRFCDCELCSVPLAELPQNEMVDIPDHSDPDHTLSSSTDTNDDEDNDDSGDNNRLPIRPTQSLRRRRRGATTIAGRLPTVIVKKTSTPTPRGRRGRGRIRRRGGPRKQTVGGVKRSCEADESFVVPNGVSIEKSAKRRRVDQIRRAVSDALFGLPAVPCRWSINEVATFVRNAGFPFQSFLFKQKEIDGEAFMELKQCHLMEYFNLKLGPALKLFAAIREVQDS